MDFWIKNIEPNQIYDLIAEKTQAKNLITGIFSPWGEFETCILDDEPIPIIKTLREIPANPHVIEFVHSGEIPISENFCISCDCGIKALVAAKLKAHSVFIIGEGNYSLAEEVKHLFMIYNISTQILFGALTRAEMVFAGLLGIDGVIISLDLLRGLSW